MKRILYLALIAVAFAACSKDKSETFGQSDLVGKWKLTTRAFIYSADPSWKPFPGTTEHFFHINSDSTFYYTCSNNLCNTISGRYKFIPSGKANIALMVRTLNTNVAIANIDTLAIEKLPTTEISVDYTTVKGDKNRYESYRYIKL